MGDILTSDELTNSHNNLLMEHVIDLRQKSVNMLEISGSCHTDQNVPHFKLYWVNFQISAVTLKMRSRSNVYYVQKSLFMGDIFTPLKRLICAEPLQDSHSNSPFGYIGEVNFGL